MKKVIPDDFVKLDSFEFILLATMYSIKDFFMVLYAYKIPQYHKFHQFI